MLKKIGLAVILLFMTFLSLQPTPYAAEGNNGKSVKLRVMSYNIHYGHNMNNQYDLESIANVIRESKADIIGLQEVDVHWADRSHFENEIKILAESLNMHYFYAPIYDFPSDQVGQPNRQFGVAILSKYPILKVENRQITRLSTQGGNTEPELLPGLAETLINVKGIKVNVYSTHLDYRPDPKIRKMQIEDMLNIMSESNKEQILIGDMNAIPTSPELAPLFSTFKDTWKEVHDHVGYTFPANQPNRTIDYILTTHGIQTESSEIIESLASDHRPLISDVILSR
ncbi:endonuclease/exonuclease/phosphatase family protein [Peribacillus butanolivorans]|uniref:endonuclease/exonuclease/phosphatase family protein n=1 Tax=Peribacillus butanolivorans TaxID=421767 RepID=UPI0030C9E250